MSQHDILSVDEFAILDQLMSERRSNDPVMDHFPGAGMDYLAASLTCNLYIGDHEDVQETFSLTSVMKLRRSDPYTNAQGLRQIDVQIEEWSAKAFSTVLKRKIECSLSAEAQPASEIVAQQPASDFPAMVTLRPRLDVTIGGKQVLRGLDCTLYGTDWVSIPPPGGDLMSVDLTIAYGPIRLVVTRSSGNRSLI